MNKMWYRVTYVTGGVLVTQQDSEKDARDRAAYVSPGLKIRSVEGFTNRTDAWDRRPR